MTNIDNYKGDFQEEKNNTKGNIKRMYYFVASFHGEVFCFLSDKKNVLYEEHIIHNKPFILQEIDWPAQKRVHFSVRKSLISQQTLFTGKGEELDACKLCSSTALRRS
jgi:hypothetical protein